MSSKRIIIVHNFYSLRAPSGENNIVNEEIENLRNRGHEVVVFGKYNDNTPVGIAGAVRVGVGAVYNVPCVRDFESLANSFKPDIVHVHNTFPLISAGIFRVKTSAPKVFTLHNYRLMCPAGVPERNGRVCTLCIDNRSTHYAIKHGCYRNSRIASIPAAFAVDLHQRLGTWTRFVDRFIALSNFQKELHVKWGLAAEKISVKPNAFSFPEKRGFIDRPLVYCTFVGRLSAEKGVKELIDAWNLLGSSAPLLKIAGDGPLKSFVEFAARNNDRIEYLGHLDPDAASNVIARSTLLIVPSLWFEGFPLNMRDAIAYNVPIACSGIGSLGDIGRNVGALTVNPYDPIEFGTAIVEFLRNPEALNRATSCSERFYSNHLEKRSNYDELEDIYDLSIRQKDSSAGKVY